MFVPYRRIQQMKVTRQTKALMLAEIYSVFCRFYGLSIVPGYKVMGLTLENVSTLYNVYKLNRQDTLSEQTQLLESWINNLIDCQEWNKVHA